MVIVKRETFGEKPFVERNLQLKTQFMQENWETA